jgi:hypothetical protein
MKISNATGKDSWMKRKTEEIAAIIVQQEEIVDILESVLTDVNDRAYVVCSDCECLNNIKGRCTIHLVKGRRKILSNGRCAEYAI